MIRDYFEELLTKQAAFQEKYKDRFHFALHRVCTAMASESLELWAKSKGKWWSKKAYPKSVQLDELADILHFFLLYMIKRGITVQELFEAYCKKLEENYARQESGKY
jgi:NTP pyrophosphatase (non-canonical NTP hydrolase)